MPKRLTEKEKLLMEPCSMGIGMDRVCTDDEWLAANLEILTRVGARTYLRGLIQVLRDGVGAYRNGVPIGMTTEDWAKMIVLNCIRNTELEGLHAGLGPSSKTGDYTDVKVVSPYGEILWNDLSRISDAEMKMLMISFVNRVFTVFSVPSQHLAMRDSPLKWDEPEIVPEMVKGMTMAACLDYMDRHGIDTTKFREAIDLPREV